MIFIPGNVPSSKNSRVWTGKFFVASKTVQNYCKNSKQYWIDQREVFLDLIHEQEPPYKVKFKFVRNSIRLFDYINPLQTVQDLMVTHGWIEDDNADFLIPKLLKYELDYSKSGVWISV